VARQDLALSDIERFSATPRRRFLQLVCAATAVPFVGCGRSHGRVDLGEAEGPPDVPDVGHDAADIGAAVEDAGDPDGGGPRADAEAAWEGDRVAELRVSEEFTILFADYGCVRHAHVATVRPQAWDVDDPVDVLDAYHVVQLRPSEIARLERGERVPFATSGGEATHGHCGLAWRSDSDPIEDYRLSAPEEAPPACELAPDPACP